MEKLKGIGVKFSIDDFGTGYSSLSYLKKFPVNILKIDRSFVSNMTDCKEDAAIVKMIIEMAHILGMKVVAEGVETREQLFLLRKKGCEFIQGYYFSKPLPEDGFEAILKSEKSISAIDRHITDYTSIE